MNYFGFLAGLLVVGASLPAVAAQDLPHGFPGDLFTGLNRCASYNILAGVCAREANDAVRASEMREQAVQFQERARHVLEAFGLDDSVGREALETQLAYREDNLGGDCADILVAYAEHAAPFCERLAGSFARLMDQVQRTSGAFYLGRWTTMDGHCEEGDSPFTLDPTSGSFWESTCEITVEALGESTAVMAWKCFGEGMEWDRRVLADRTETGMTMIYLDGVSPDDEGRVSRTVQVGRYRACPALPAEAAR